MAVSHRGFGKSEGSPTEAGLYADARTAIDWAEGTLKMPSKKLIYFGESLGSGVAVQMATERPPGLLVLQAPYTSLETRAAELYPFVIGVRHLVRDKYELAVENRQCQSTASHFAWGERRHHSAASWEGPFCRGERT